MFYYKRIYDTINVLYNVVHIILREIYADENTKDILILFNGE